MTILDVFKQDAFSTVTLTAALAKTPFLPQYLDSLSIFDERPIRTLSASFEKQDNVLSLVQTSPRNSPIKQRALERRDIRNVDLRNVRIALGDRITADEILGIREFGQETQLKQLTSEVMDRMVRVRNDILLTHENQRMGALNGLVLDADGSTLMDWFQFWGITRPAPFAFTFNQTGSNGTVSNGSIRQTSAAVARAMQRAAKGSWLPGTQIVALCSDGFFDALTATKEARETYLNYEAAADLREPTAFRSFNYAGITWINYRGTDDNSTVAIPAGTARFFPVGARDAFQRIMAPGEGTVWAAQPGQPIYSAILPDVSGRDGFVDVELTTHSLYACLRPEMLQSATFS